MNKNTPHPYAAVLRAIADGYPVQWQGTLGTWKDQSVGGTLAEIEQASYAPERYRVRPSTVTLAGYEVARPFTVPPEFGATYWYLNPNYDENVDYYEWDGGSTDRMLLDGGMCWLNKQDALDAVVAIRAALKGETK